jgi:hypothetical protein
MKMFVWQSEALRNYSSGTLVAMAETPDEARGLILERIPNYAIEMCLVPVSARSMDDMEDWEKESFDAFMKKVASDLEKEPFVMKNSVLFIEGGE